MLIALAIGVATYIALRIVTVAPAIAGIVAGIAVVVWM